MPPRPIYNKKRVLQQAKELAEKQNGVFNMSDIIALLPCGRATFYALIPQDSPEMQELRDIIEANIIKTKAAIRGKLYTNGKDTGLIALYKMIATKEEREAISMVNTDITTKGQSINRYEEVDLDCLSEDEQQQLINISLKIEDANKG